MKKMLLALLSALFAAVCVFGGCITAGEDGKDGADGKDGKDASVYEVYEKLNEELAADGEPTLTFDEFVREYFNYSDGELEEALSEKAVINRSLLSTVSVLTRFPYTSRGYFGSSTVSYKVFTGSGVIVWLDKEEGDAYVVTNAHVVYASDADEIYCPDVRLYLYGQDIRNVNYTVTSSYDITDDENYRISATVVGATVSYDLALLKVEGSEVLKNSAAVAAEFAEGDINYVGESVYAVGNADGRGIAVTDGIISKDSENILLDFAGQAYYRELRTSAAINGGNSGGGLFNKEGRIVGIVNAKDENSGIDNIGFALPAGRCKRLLQLMYEQASDFDPAKGGVTKCKLGITMQTTDTYSYLNESGFAEIVEIRTISSVNDDSVFYGKLLEGDVLKHMKITSADGDVKEDFDVTRSYLVDECMFSARVGDTVTFTVKRVSDGVTVSEELSAEVTATQYIS